MFRKRHSVIDHNGRELSRHYFRQSAVDVCMMHNGYARGTETTYYVHSN